MRLISRLLRKNISAGRVVGFIISNFIGLAIIAGGVQLYTDARSLWSSDDSFMNADILVVNKKVTSAGTWDAAASDFTPAEIADLSSQPWVREVGAFTANDYRVWASVGTGSGPRSLSTMLFFEAVPDKFVDTSTPEWTYRPGDNIVPIIISKDYLALYNFGFAGSAGLPRMSESILSGIPLKLIMTSEDGSRSLDMTGHVVGLSDRLNTILVPESFMDWSNAQLGTHDEKTPPSRLIVDVSSPGDTAIRDYLSSHSLEVAGDKSNSAASFLLNVAAAVVLAVGGVISILSLFVLMLSMSLLMEKNRDKLHTLLMLGYPAGEVARPYEGIIVLASLVAWLLASGGSLWLRHLYIDALGGLGITTGSGWEGAAAAAAVTAITIIANIISVRRRTRASFR